MTKAVSLKDINFPEFKAKLEKISHRKGFELRDDGESFVLSWDNNWLGVGYEVEVYKVDDGSVVYNINLERLLRLVIILWLVLLIIFYGNLLIFFASAVFLSVLLYWAVWYDTDHRVRDLFELAYRIEEEYELVGKEEAQGLHCPACGESLTEYDEYCPSCGLYLGKVWKRQPATRTGYEGVRLEYKFKRNNSGES